MKRFLYSGVIALSLLFVSNSSNATTINYELNSLGGSSWEYAYSVHNDTLSQDIEEFTIFFDYGLYSNLSVTGAPIDWDPIVVEPQEILGFPESGFYDALALSFGIAPGETLGGFSVSFDWLGAGTPGSQYFEIVDPWDFTALDSGMTSAAVAAAPVPEPGTILLVGAGLVGLLGLRKKLKA